MVKRMVQLARSIPVVNLHRFYMMTIAPTLFGEYALVMEWGRIGFPGTVREQLFDNEQAAESALSKRVTGKTKRGYIRVPYRAAL